MLAVVPPLIAFAFSWPWVTDFSFVAVYATVAGGDLLPPPRRRAGAASG